MPAVCMQIVDSDLIGVSAGALAALLRGQCDRDPWKDIAMLALDVSTSVLVLLEAAPSLQSFDAAVVDAGWKGCGEVRLPENVARVRPLYV